MSDITSNRTGEYLKAHAEIEAEGAAYPIPSPGRLFNQHWQAAVALMIAKGEREPSAQFKAIAETFFLWGWYDGRLTP